MVSTGLKICVTILSVFVLVIGIALGAVGIWTLVSDHGLVQLGSIEDDGTYAKDLAKPGLLETAAVLAIVVGALMIVLAVGTLYATWAEISCILGLCAAFFIALILLDISIIILAAVTKQRKDDYLETALFEGVRSQYIGNIESANTFSNVFDKAQAKFECCGVNDTFNALNYSTSWRYKTSLQVPKTCCKLEDKDEYLDNDRFFWIDVDCANDLSLNLYHTDLCVEPIDDWLEEKIFVLVGLTVPALAFKLLAVLATVIMTRKASDKKPDVKTYHYQYS